MPQDSKSGTGLARRAGYEIVGRGGQALSDQWADGASTLHGLASRDFPNCFHLSPLQAGFTVNFPHLLTEQGQHLAYIIQQARGQGARCVEPSVEAESAWVQEVVDKAELRDDFFESCTPGDYNNEGRPAERSSQDSF